MIYRNKELKDQGNYMETLKTKGARLRKTQSRMEGILVFHYFTIL